MSFWTLLNWGIIGYFAIIGVGCVLLVPVRWVLELLRMDEWFQPEPLPEPKVGERRRLGERGRQKWMIWRGDRWVLERDYR